jgi:hypothetical protein
MILQILWFYKFFSRFKLLRAVVNTRCLLLLDNLTNLTMTCMKAPVNFFYYSFFATCRTVIVVIIKRLKIVVVIRGRLATYVVPKHFTPILYVPDFYTSENILKLLATSSVFLTWKVFVGMYPVHNHFVLVQTWLDLLLSAVHASLFCLAKNGFKIFDPCFGVLHSFVQCRHLPGF